MKTHQQKRLSVKYKINSIFASLMFLGTSALTTGVIPLEISIKNKNVTNIEPAQAGFVQDAINKIGPRNLWYALNQGRFTQYWFRSIDANLTWYYNQKYGSQAQGVLHRQCTTLAKNHYGLNWWERRMLDIGYQYFFVVARQSNGVTHCYVRIMRGW